MWEFLHGFTKGPKKPLNKLNDGRKAKKEWRDKSILALNLSAIGSTDVTEKMTCTKDGLKIKPSREYKEPKRKIKVKGK